jgi:hypothetical protein
MKRLIESEEVAGLESLLGENVLLLCANYFYAGKLVGVNKSCVELENPSTVYETGAWENKSYADAQKMHVKKWYVQLEAIESFGLGK